MLNFKYKNRLKKLRLFKKLKPKQILIIVSISTVTLFVVSLLGIGYLKNKIQGSPANTSSTEIKDNLDSKKIKNPTQTSDGTEKTTSQTNTPATNTTTKPATGQQSIDFTVTPTSLTFVAGSSIKQQITMQSVGGASLSYGQNTETPGIFFGHENAGNNPTSGIYSPKISIASSLAPGSYTLVVFGQQTKPLKKVTKTLNITVLPKPSYTLTAEAEMVWINRDTIHCEPVNIWVSRQNNHTDPIQMSANITESPGGISVDFATNPVPNGQHSALNVCINSLSADAGEFEVNFGGYSQWGTYTDSFIIHVE